MTSSSLIASSLIFSLYPFQFILHIYIRVIFLKYNYILCHLKLLMAPCCFYIKVQTFIMIFNTLFLWFLPNSLDSPFFPIVLCSIYTKLSVVPLMHPLSPSVTLLASHPTFTLSSGSLRSSHAPLLLLLPHSSSFSSSANFYLPYNLQLWFHFIWVRCSSHKLSQNHHFLPQ